MGIKLHNQSLFLKEATNVNFTLQIPKEKVATLPRILMLYQLFLFVVLDLLLFWFGFFPKGSANLASLKVSSVGVFLAALFPALSWLVCSVHTDLHFWHLSRLTLSSRVEHLLSSYCLISQVQHIGVNKHHFQTKLPSIYRLLPQISLDMITAILSHFQY